MWPFSKRKERVRGRDYIYGTDVLGDAPYYLSKPGAELVPGGNLYTDRDTIVRLQTALVADGYPLDVDGVFGPKTEEALFKSTTAKGSAWLGPPNEGVLALYGIKPPARGVPAAPPPRPPLLSSLFPPRAPALPGAPPPPAAGSFWSRPVFAGGPTGKAAVAGVAAGVAVVAGLVYMKRR